MKLYDYFLRKYVEMSTQLNSNVGIIWVILIVLGLLAYFTITSKNFHGIGHR